MKTSDFDYKLDKNLIAQSPAKPRDASRLMVVLRSTGEIVHTRFYQLPDFLEPKDLIVLNNTRVFSARLIGQKELTKGKIEILLVSPKQPVSLEKPNDWPSQWRVLVKGKVSPNQKVKFSKNLKGEIRFQTPSEKFIIFNQQGKELFNEISKIGLPPTPPYIKNLSQKSALKRSYQTVYAQKLGSIAAPTAGLHFTERLFKKLSKKGINTAFITLHVGLGTFKPIKSEHIENHKMESEFAVIPEETARIIKETRENHHRVVAVGTTVTRTLEGLLQDEKITAKSDWVNLFIYPPFEFKIVSSLITNFHLPRSTPLLLTASFCPKELLFKAYNEAIKKRYRFFSFGDAMLIL